MENGRLFDMFTNYELFLVFVYFNMITNRWKVRSMCLLHLFKKSVRKSYQNQKVSGHHKYNPYF